MTKESAQFLLSLVNGLTLTIGAPDFDDVFPLVIKARAELKAIIDGPTVDAD